jgi:hypothetical protein
MEVICNEHKTNICDLHVTSDGQFFNCDAELIVFKQKVVSQICMKLRAVAGVTAVNVINLENNDTK